MISLSILDYSPIDEGSTAGEALQQTTRLAQLAEKIGYKRFWVAEHHQVFSVAGSSPEMLMMHLAGATQNIRIGSGGVMLPHYSSYKVAENFRLMEALHPGRIDLGIGRSRSYRLVNKALNESKGIPVSYEQQIADIQKYFTDDTESEHRFQKLRVTPVSGTAPEMWVLGTGEGSVKVAAEAGAAYAYAHFAKPLKSSAQLIESYKKQFQPSKLLDAPKAMVCVFAVVGETEEEAEDLAKAFDLWLLFVESDTPPPYYPSVETAKQRGFSASELEKVERNRKRMLIGTPKQVKQQIEEIADAYQTDEVLVIPNVSGEDSRMKEIRLLAEVFGLEG
ncbi:LLM class flavin-dependent oxidoreductase [Planococcus halotolerans]|uniref:LLM class flavin-dependent oxidoreductase n=1 Tax=Planococcus halotolerans TaxID=2233542 RepID=A0A365KWQ0_9BACL|nr:LLM class flavin-dependent oxidoreductase [Planococcus halotolerans]QHJ69182.1 MsnO8 family LLM class oxidoreductase [Planococcus halotolerans]RAZ77616.1 LLM class flavin-dependent oxidoreductase [Planococcus halotolerans]